jgi:hypothetical protein
MKPRATFPALLMLLLPTTIVTTQSSSATAPDQGPSAFGQGSFAFLNAFRDVPRFEQWDFSFDVTANKKGHARGRAIFNISGTEVVVKIDCLEIQGSLPSASAIMTGVVLHSDNPNYPKRAKVFFAADDNTGSPFLPTDTITPLFILFEGFEDCHDIGHPLTILPAGDSITIEP